MVATRGFSGNRFVNWKTKVPIMVLRQQSARHCRFRSGAVVASSSAVCAFAVRGCHAPQYFPANALASVTCFGDSKDGFGERRQ